MELPPLFQKDFTDHGCVTGQYFTKASAQANLKKFLRFLEETRLYGLLVPSTRDNEGKGYKVNSADSRIPKDIRTALNGCTTSFATTEDYKSVRRRFLDIENLKPEVAEHLKAKVLGVTSTYENWLLRRVQQIEKQKTVLGKQFQSFCLGLSSKRYVWEVLINKKMVGFIHRSSDPSQPGRALDNKNSKIPLCLLSL